ncbi:hypothetical protein E4U41_006108 [Claviceps citrina]|nr:hypothetical protein E4U41_006108 [Claviceps citrina]
MLESNIRPGRQDVAEDAQTGQRRAEYGVSITDGCIGWHETSAVLGKLAAAVRIRQQKLAVAASLENKGQFEAEKSIVTRQAAEVLV